jgi:predicted DNA binding CopG/RHH family protein
MPRKSTNIPKVRSEAEEGEWYATPQGRKIAKTDPKVLEQLMEQAKQTATRAIWIRVPIADLEQAQRIAAATGVGYQAVLKQAIRAGLKRAG